MLFRSPPVDLGACTQISASGERSVAVRAVQVACPADIDHDGIVAGLDLSIILAGWGGNGPADIDHNGIANGLDLAILLSGWGACQN